MKRPMRVVRHNTILKILLREVCNRHFSMAGRSRGTLRGFNNFLHDKANEESLIIRINDQPSYKGTKVNITLTI